MCSGKTVSKKLMCLISAGLIGYLFLGFTSVANAQSFVPPEFDPVDPIDMKRLTSENMSFIPFKMGVLATPIMCTTPGEIIEGAVNMMGGGNQSLTTSIFGMTGNATGGNQSGAGLMGGNESAGNMLGGGGGGGDNATSVRELAAGQVGISEDMVEQELQEALNFIICIPSTINEETGLGGTQNNLTGSMEEGMMMMQ